MRHCRTWSEGSLKVGRERRRGSELSSSGKAEEGVNAEACTA